MKISRLFLSLCIATLLVAGARSAELDRTTEAERLYRELRYAADRSTQLLGDRWYGLVKLQDWVSAGGSHSISAKYVEHDPELTWVKLRVIHGSGAELVVQDIQVELENLDKASRRRVEQIAFLSEKVNLAVAEVQAEGEDDDASPRQRIADDESTDEQFEGQFDDSDEVRPSPLRPREDINGDDEMEDEPIFDEAIQPTPPATSPSPAQQQAAIEPIAWRTDYKAFLANIDLKVDENGEHIDWGMLPEMANMAEIANQRNGRDVSAEKLAEIDARMAEVSQRLGNVVWNAIFLELQTQRSSDLPAVNLDLPQPDAVFIVFKLDEQAVKERWLGLSSGTPIRVVGRVTMDGSSSIVIHIRMVGDI